MAVREGTGKSLAAGRQQIFDYRHVFYSGKSDATRGLGSSIRSQLSGSKEGMRWHALHEVRDMRCEVVLGR